MSELEVRIVKLEPIQVASFSGFGKNPEDIAWEKLLDWAKKPGIPESFEGHRFFGFNNPNPAPGSPNYGYEQWITIGPDTQVGEGIEVKDFPGGLYAVTRCVGIEDIGKTWKALVAWSENSPYQHACHQWLEECISPVGAPEMILDLYLPIAE